MNCIVRTISILLSISIPFLITTGCQTNEVTKQTIDNNLQNVKKYLTTKSDTLATKITTLRQVANNLSNTDNNTEAALTEAKKVFLEANTTYELIEGIVAGVPSLAKYDIDLDSGVEGSSSNTDNAVSFDITLPDGRVLKKPGNYFAITEALLWATKKEWMIDGKNKPDPKILEAVLTSFEKTVQKLKKDAYAWSPTYGEAFTALIVMIPTMDEYFQGWKESRLIKNKTTQFIAVSRLSDILDILSGLIEVAKNLENKIATKDKEASVQIVKELHELKDFVEDIYTKEKKGYKFTAKDADVLGYEAQYKASQISGKITQVAAKLGIKVK